MVTGKLQGILIIYSLKSKFSDALRVNIRPTEPKIMFTDLRPRHVWPAAFKTRFFGFHEKKYFFPIFRPPGLELSIQTSP